MSRIPSPCVDVCKFKLKDRCIGCTMTKKQKKSFGKLKSDKKKMAFMTELLDQQKALGRHEYWLKAYVRKCAKKGVRPAFQE
ncbi:MAG: DUF1289 domain-containing protein [Pseudomonadota bacterium]